MSEIKTWDEVLDSQISDGQVVTTTDIREAMQAEIDNLRAALADRDAKLAALEGQEPVGDGYTRMATTIAGDLERVVVTGIPVYAAAGAAPISECSDGEIYSRLSKRDFVAAPVPTGWQLVPVEPTQGMIDAFVRVPYDDSPITECRDGWKAMLEAAPKDAP